MASFLGVDPKWVTREVKLAIERALDIWPKVAYELLGER